MIFLEVEVADDAADEEVADIAVCHVYDVV
jgi:hypothetical protein